MSNRLCWQPCARRESDNIVEGQVSRGDKTRTTVPHTAPKPFIWTQMTDQICVTQLVFVNEL